MLFNKKILEEIINRLDYVEFTTEEINKRVKEIDKRLKPEPKTKTTKKKSNQQAITVNA